MTIFGWDMSHYDAPGIGSALAEGVSFITHKAGGDQLDTELGAWWAGVRGLDPDRVLLGAYWVLYPGAPSARADAFLARLDAVCPGWRLRPFMLQVDCEKWGGDPGTVPDRADIAAFCDRLVDLCPRLRPIVYAPKWTYGNTLSGLGYPLWASSYVNGVAGFRALYPGDGSSRWGAYSGQVPAILQYSSSATIGGQSTCDANAYRGTLAELTAIVAPGWTEDDVAAEDVWEYKLDGKQSAAGFLVTEGARSRELREATLPAMSAAIAGMAATLKDFTGRDFVDEAAIVGGVLAGLDPAAIAAAVVAALPTDQARRVADELAARLAA